MKLTFTKIIVLVVIFSLIGGLSVGGAYWYLDNEFSNDPVEFIQGNRISIEENDEYSIEEVAENTGPSIVAISIKSTQTGFFSSAYETQVAGSGIILDKNNTGIYVITNNHVIENANEMVVDFGDNIIGEAELVGTDSDTDIAVILVKKGILADEIYERITPAVFGDSDKLRVGERAIAIGNPLGYNHTVTVGIISALNRDLMLSYNDINLIQTDAAINPGNSGGALVNAYGEVIGINTIKISDTTVEGIGFAIPINGAFPIIEALVEEGYVQRPYLGISARTVTDDIAINYDLPKGAYISEIDPNGAAYKAGLRVGDIIIEFNEVTIDSIEKLIEEKFKSEIGDIVEIKAITEDGTESTFTVEFKKN